MLTTVEIAMIVASEFGIAESHVMEVIRRIREQDFYIRETRSKTRRPVATPRHLSNLFCSLISGSSSRAAPDQIRLMENCQVNSHYFRNLAQPSKSADMDTEFKKYFYNDNWADQSYSPGGKAPFHGFISASEFGSGFSLVDCVECIIDGLANYPEIYQQLACTEIAYEPDRNKASVRFVLSTFDSTTNLYVPIPRGDYSIEHEFSFVDSENDFKGNVVRTSCVELMTLNRLAKALRRGAR